MLMSAVIAVLGAGHAGRMSLGLPGSDKLRRWRMSSRYATSQLLAITALAHAHSVGCTGNFCLCRGYTCICIFMGGRGGEGER